MMTAVMAKPHQLIASDRVEGTAVRRPNGNRIGHIERLMIDKSSGRVSYAVLSFGGFLGIGASGPVIFTGELLRHAVYGVMLGLMYPILRTRRPVKVRAHTPTELTAGFFALMPMVSSVRPMMPVTPYFH